MQHKLKPPDSRSKLLRRSCLFASFLAFIIGVSADLTRCSAQILEPAESPESVSSLSEEFLGVWKTISIGGDRNSVKDRAFWISEDAIFDIWSVSNFVGKELKDEQRKRQQQEQLKFQLKVLACDESSEAAYLYVKYPKNMDAYKGILKLEWIGDDKLAVYFFPRGQRKNAGNGSRYVLKRFSRDEGVAREIATELKGNGLKQRHAPP